MRTRRKRPLNSDVTDIFSRACALRAAGFGPRYYTAREWLVLLWPSVAMVPFSLLRTTRVRTGFRILDGQWKGSPKVGFPGSLPHVFWGLGERMLNQEIPETAHVPCQGP